jgi:hypothetical protein
MTIRIALVLFACLAVAPFAHAQALPSEPVSVAGGRVTIAGDVSASFGSADPGWFNYTDYEHFALRLMRVDVSAVVNAGDHFAVLGELRSENLEIPEPYALYVRIRPWITRHIDIQAGRIPPTFGAFARRTYASDNPLIGYPLAYQYLTSIRPDSVPATADELLARRGSGWLTRYTIGNVVADRGVPLVTAFRWDTGVQLHAGAPNGPISATASVTTGTVSNPLFSDDNGGRQIAGRVELRPAAGIIVGASAARGPFLTNPASRLAAGEGHDNEFTQTALGGDLELSHGYYLLRVESILSAWRLPVVRTPALTQPLRALSTSVEGRYRIRPGFYAAARFDHIGFNDLTGTRATQPWDAPVSRVEVGAGYSLVRNLLLKASVQDNVRHGYQGPGERRGRYGETQIVWWF